MPADMREPVEFFPHGSLSYRFGSGLSTTSPYLVITF